MYVYIVRINFFEMNELRVRGFGFLVWFNWLSVFMFATVVVSWIIISVSFVFLESLEG